jgi:alkylhydroperoxidase/carboxymuconolactone decarboxylase family protein YurZ
MDHMADETMNDERPLLDTIVEMTAASVERTDLDGRELLMVRLAALAAVDAPVSSYLLSIAAATGTDLTLEDARSVLIAIAPIVGAPRVVTAAGTIAEALGIALALEDAIADYSSEAS